MRMVMKGIPFAVAVNSLLVLQFCSAAEFQNLGFDGADQTGPPPVPADAAAFLPGWTLYLGGEPHDAVYVNPTLLPPGGNYAVLGNGREFGGRPTEGKFALRFVRSDPFAPVWKLEQIGTIPTSTKFLTYRCFDFGMQVQIDEEIIPPLDWQLPGQFGSSNLVYDVSKFAGQEVKLSFVGPFGPYGWPGFEGLSRIDSVAFLSEAPRITAALDKVPGATTNQVVLRFAPIAGRNIFVEFKDDLGRESVWQGLPGGPHNSGTVIDKSPASHRIYRLRIVVPWQ